jgi:hypothetical protein
LARNNHVTVKSALVEIYTLAVLGYAGHDRGIGTQAIQNISLESSATLDSHDNFQDREGTHASSNLRVVERLIAKFPVDLMFALTQDEWAALSRICDL